jgi:hypothetical protein
MSQLNVVKNAVSADQIYFDVTVTNTQSTITVPPIFYYNEARTIPFVSNPEDYYLSILRFTVDTGTLPVFIPTIKPNQSNRDATIYSVTVEYTDPLSGDVFVKQQFIEWFPQDASIKPPPPPPSQTANKQQVIETGYYNCYSYSYWCYLVDVAMKDAFDDVVAQGLAHVPPVAIPAQYAPVMTWDTTSASASLFAQASYFTNTTPPVFQQGFEVNPFFPSNEPVRLYFNAPLFSLFSSFPAKYLGFQGVTDGKNFLFEPSTVGGTQVQTVQPPFNSGQTPSPTPPQAPPASWIACNIYQEFSTTPSWSPITAFVFTSNTLPINPNQVSTPLVFTDATQVSLGGNNADTLNIITDLVSDDGTYKPNLVYEPTAQYRYITLFGNRPLFNIDLQIFYRTKLGGLVPFRLQSGGTVTLKIAFIKKSSIQ